MMQWKRQFFGSRARGDHRERSDYDIAIYVRNNEYMQFLGEIDEISTLLKIDITIIMPESSFDKVFLENVEREGRIIYGEI